MSYTSQKTSRSFTKPILKKVTGQNNLQKQFIILLSLLFLSAALSLKAPAQFYAQSNFAPNAGGSLLSGLAKLETSGGGTNSPAMMMANVVVDPTNMNGWTVQHSTCATPTTATGQFKNGPGTPPLGGGSYRVSIGSNGDSFENLRSPVLNTTPLGQITTLSYSSYVTAFGSGGQAHYIILNIDLDGNTTIDDQIFFEPVYQTAAFFPSNPQPAIALGTWQTWDALNGGWWSLNSLGGATPGTGVKSLSQYLAAQPTARVIGTVASGGLRLSTGCGGAAWANFVGSFDNVMVGISGSNTTFDFEPPTALTVTPAASPTAADNDYTRINNAVQSIANGGTITLSGTFDWTEANAAASWVLGSDGVAATGDDYSVLIPANLNNVTFTAASLGSATIQGPGDLAAVDLEGVLYFDGAGDNQNWTISNIRFLDFDMSIGMFGGAGGADGFNDTKILNNFIRIPNDLNATVAPNDTFQNIGIHFAYGTNQQISGNEIVTPGDGVSDSANSRFSSIVGMQSNTSGGSIYNNLQITNNTLRVLNTQSSDPSTFLGIWENAHGHTSNINITGNQFLNMSGGNNPSLNLQRAFRITSHSSATTTVTYSHNRVEGANIGFQWITGSNFAGNQPVVVKSNTILNGATGVLVQSNGLANLTFNRIVGNSVAGVNNASAGTVTAENNWWGCNYGPGSGGAGCSGTANGITGTVDANPWLTLTTAASPSSISTGGNSAITSKLTINSDNIDTSASSNIPDGTPASFAATLGTVMPTAGVTTAGVTTTTFTAGASAGTGSATTTVDGQTVNAPVTIAFSCNNVSIPNNITAKRNTAVTVPLNVDDLTGRNIISYDFTLTYNPAVLTYTGVDSTGTLSSGMVITINSNTPGTLIVSGFDSAALTGSGTLLKFNFNTTGGIGTTSNMNFSGFMFNEGIPCVNTVNGLVTIISGTVTGTITYVNAATPPVPVPNVTLSGVGSVNVSTTTNLSGQYTLSDFGAGAYTVTPSKSGDVNGIDAFDSARIAQHVVSLFTLNATQLQAADVSENNQVTSFDAGLIAQYVVSIPNTGSTGTWKFTPPDRNYANVETDQTNQDYSAILMGEVTGNWMPPTMLAELLQQQRLEEARRDENPAAGAIGVTAPNLSTSTGQPITIPLTVQDTTGEGIISYQFDLIYDSGVIQPQANVCDTAGTMSSNMLATCNPNPPQPMSLPAGQKLIKVAVFGTMPLTGSGTLLNLKFNAIGPGGSTSVLKFPPAPASGPPPAPQPFKFNEGIPTNMTTDGQVQILGPTAAGVTIGGYVLTAAGQPVSNAKVFLTNNSGGKRQAISNGFGYYRFEDVTVGEVYILNVVSKRYTFLPRAVNVTEELTVLNLIAEP